MRKVLLAEGAGTVRVKRRRGLVRHHGRYVGQVCRFDGGMWGDPTEPGVRYRSPSEAAESMIDGLD